MHRRRCVLALPAAAAAMALPSVWAQTSTWPSRDLKLLVGFSKNSTSEVVASALIPFLEQSLGRKVELQTITGKSGTVAAAEVAQSQDAHTFGIVVNNALTVAKMLDPALPYDPEKDLLPVALLTRTPMVLVGQAGSGTDTRAFLEAGRQAGERWRYGSQGHGSIGHLGFELFKARSGFRAQHQPLAGGPEVVQALKDKSIDVALLPMTLALRGAASAALQPYSVAARRRSPLAPQWSLLTEAGVPFDIAVWAGAVVPRSMPEAARLKLEAALVAAVRQPSVAALLNQSGQEVPSEVGASALLREVRHETSLLGGIAMMRGLVR
jgi:tripartite-type tricarboxylate transporter receptor subunit TctC